MKIINKGSIFITLLILMITTISLMNTHSKSTTFEDTILYDEAKFYGISFNLDNLGLKNHDKEFPNNLDITQAKFWGIPMDLLRNNKNIDINKNSNRECK